MTITKDNLVMFGSGVIIFFLIATPVYFISKWFSDHPCIESHDEKRHSDGYTYYIKSGNIMIPEVVSPSDYTVTICDKRK